MVAPPVPYLRHLSQDDPLSRGLAEEWAAASSRGAKVALGRMQPWVLRARHGQQRPDAPAFDMAVAEPFYRSCEGLLPWAALRCEGGRAPAPAHPQPPTAPPVAATQQPRTALSPRAQPST